MTQSLQQCASRKKVRKVVTICRHLTAKVKQANLQLNSRVIQGTLGPNISLRLQLKTKMFSHKECKKICSKLLIRRMQLVMQSKLKIATEVTTLLTKPEKNPCAICNNHLALKVLVLSAWRLQRLSSLKNNFPNTQAWWLPLSMPKTQATGLRKAKQWWLNKVFITRVQLNHPIIKCRRRPNNVWWALSRTKTRRRPPTSSRATSAAWWSTDIRLKRRN